jgi:hypothetical protein
VKGTKAMSKANARQNMKRALKPTQRKRKDTRPDLFRKARNVMRNNGPDMVKAWAEAAMTRGEPVALVLKARDKAMNP